MNNDKLNAALKVYTKAAIASCSGEARRCAAQDQIEECLVEEQTLWRLELNKLENAAGGRWKFRRNAPYAHMSGVFFLVNHGDRPMTGRVMCSASLHAAHQHGPDITVHATAPWEDREKLLDDLRRIMDIKTKGK